MRKLTSIALGASILAMTAGSVACSAAQANDSATYTKTVEDFIKNSSTYKFDGIDGSFKVVKAVEDAGGAWDLTVDFQTRQPGHGNRSGQVLAQVITSHEAQVEIKGGKVDSAVCDGKYDLVSENSIVTPGEEFTLKVGQQVEIAGENTVITFDSVLTDSRSPRGVQTIWAGEAKIQLVVVKDGVRSTVVLTEKGSTDGYTDGSIDGRAVVFKLSPYPEAGKQPTVADYRLQMKVVADQGPAGGTMPAEDNHNIYISADQFAAQAHVTRQSDVEVGGLITIRLDSNATTGFQWNANANIDGAGILSQTDHAYLAPGQWDGGPLGASGLEEWTFKADKAGTATISLSYDRPWAGGEKGVRTFELAVTVQ